MLETTYKKFWIFPVKEYRYWYQNGGGKSSLITSIFISQIRKKLNIEWAFEKVCYTWILDLKLNEEDLMKKFSHTIRNEIRRAEKEGITYTYILKPDLETLKKYHQFYLKFAKIKKLEKIPFSAILKHRNYLALTYSIYEGDILNYHTYIVDKTVGETRLYQSCSLFREENEKSKINLIWYWNRWLHFYDMLLFKKLGYHTYDFWWISLSDNDEKRNVDKFKLWFWPTIIEEYIYEKSPLLLRYAYKIISRIRALKR